MTLKAKRLAAANGKPHQTHENLDADPIEYLERNGDLPTRGAPEPTPDDRAPRLARLSDVEPVAVEWLWQDRIPVGRLTVLAGRPGCGKSMMSLDWAARVTCGRDWPDGSYCPSGSVLILAAEDDLGDTIRPRLDAARADASRVVALQGMLSVHRDGSTSNKCITLADIDVIEAALDTMPDCRLVIVDPIGSYLGGQTDSHRDNEVRAVLAPLADLANRRGVAVLCVAHTRKGGAAIHADDAVLASVAFVGIARSVLHVLPDLDDPESKRKLLLPGKCNLAPPSSGWAFTISGHPPRVVYGERVEQSADDAVQAAARPGPESVALREATDWLRKAIAEGPRLAKEIADEATNGAGITAATLRRAREAAEVEAYRPVNLGPWWWRLPGQAHPDAQPSPQAGELEHLEHVGENTANTGGSEGSEVPHAQVLSSEHVDDLPKPKRKKRAKRIEPKKAERMLAKNPALSDEFIAKASGCTEPAVCEMRLGLVNSGRIPA